MYGMQYQLYRVDFYKLAQISVYVLYDSSI